MRSAEGRAGMWADGTPVISHTTHGGAVVTPRSRPTRNPFFPTCKMCVFWDSVAFTVSTWGKEEAVKKMKRCIFLQKVNAAGFARVVNKQQKVICFPIFLCFCQGIRETKALKRYCLQVHVRGSYTLHGRCKLPTWVAFMRSDGWKYRVAWKHHTQMAIEICFFFFYKHQTSKSFQISHL